jgi:hypothetical protein
MLTAGGCTKKPAEADFKLEPGRYSLHMRFKMLRKGKLESDDQQTHTVDVKVDGEKVTITNPEQPDIPIVGQLRAGRLAAKLDDAGGTADLVARLVADNRMEGTLLGKSKDGEQTFQGAWTLEPAK